MLDSKRQRSRICSNFHLEKQTKNGRKLHKKVLLNSGSFIGRSCPVLEFIDKFRSSNHVTRIYNCSLTLGRELNLVSLLFPKTLPCLLTACTQRHFRSMCRSVFVIAVNMYCSRYLSEVFSLIILTVLKNFPRKGSRTIGRSVYYRAAKIT